MNDAKMTEEKTRVVRFGPDEMSKCLYLLVKMLGGCATIKVDKVLNLDPTRKLHISYDRVKDCYVFAADVAPQTNNNIYVPSKELITP